MGNNIYPFPINLLPAQILKNPLKLLERPARPLLYLIHLHLLKLLIFLLAL